MKGFPEINVHDTKTTVNVKWSESHISRCNVKWLRFHCRCKRCVPEFSGMFPLDKDEYDNNLYVTNAEIKDETLLMVIDKELMDNHVTTIPLNWLKENCNCDACLDEAILNSNFKFVDPSKVEIPRVAYDSFDSKDGKFSCLEKVFGVGFCVVEKVPREDQLVAKIGDMFGWVTQTEKTQHKKYFDVEFDAPEIEDIGPIYRQDSPYYESMPGGQIVHVLNLDSSKDCTCSMVDLFQAADIMKDEFPADFKVLCNIPGKFEMKNNKGEQPTWYEHARTHFEVDYFGNTVTIYWNPVVEGTLRVYHEDEGPYYNAYAKFLSVLTRRELQFSVPLKEDEMLIINNRRMGHAWKRSDKAGKPKMQGCFINIDDMKSTYMVLAYQLGKKVFSPKCGNRSWF